MTGEANNAADRLPKHRVIGRYALFDEIAAGGMATVHLGRLVGPVGFSRIVAIKRLHPQYAKDPEFVSMFLDEARLASRIQHPNVVSTLDIVTLQGEVFLVMEYVQGESLSKLVRNASREDTRMPPGHVASVMAGVLHGLHAAHEAKSERREPLNIVHRDVSPQNILVGTDGIARVLDFGVAKAALRAHSTRDGQMKGKLSYMSPEQLNGKGVDRRTDIFAAGVVLWEALCGKRLFEGADAGEIFAKVLTADLPEPKSIVEDISEELNWVVMRALERDPTKRFQTAREFAIELESTGTLSTPRAVGEWVERFGGEDVRHRVQLVADVESVSTDVVQESEPEIVNPVLAEPDDFLSAESSVSGSRLRQRAPSEARTEPDAPLPRSSVTPPPRPSVAPPSSEPEPLLSDAPPPLSMPPRRGLSPATLAAAACIGGGFIAYFIFAGGASEPPPAKNATQVVARTPAAPGTGLDDSQTARSKTPTVSVDDLPALPAEDAGGATTKKAQPAQRPKAPKSKSAKASANCNPPWIIDEKNIRRLKPECL